MPLNILHIIQRYPPALGGSEAYFARLSKWLVARGHRVDVWTTDAHDLTAFWQKGKTRLPAGTEILDGVSVKRFPIDHWPLRRYILKAASLLPVDRWKAWTIPVNPISMAMLKEAERTERKFDVVHASAFPYLFPCLCGLKLARRIGVPFVLTPFVHIGPWNDKQNRIRKAYLAKPMVWLLKQADLIFVQTPSEKQAIIEVGVKEERIVLQGLGVDIAEVTGGNRERARASWGVEENEFVIGHLANQSFEKGTMHLLETVKYLDIKRSLIRVVLAGPQMPIVNEFFEENSDLLKRRRVIQLGTISEEAKKDFFAGIDLFCLPSISDSFGLVLLEAMANGKPCLGFRAGGIGDVLAGGGGWLIDYESPGQMGLSSRLASLIDSPDRELQARQALKRCQTEFDWHSKLEMVEKHIERLRICQSEGLSLFDVD